MNKSCRLGRIDSCPFPSPPRRGAVMPRKSKNSPTLENTAPKRKRGRPRRTVAPEALAPFEKCTVAKVAKSKSSARKLSTAEAKPQKRRLSPTTSDKNYSSDEVEFMNALAEFKRASGRTFPTCSEILGILRGLGYEKIT